MEKLKECRRCFELKPRSEFHKSGRQEDGLQTWCKQCINEYKIEWRAKKRSPELKAAKAHIIENRELAKEGLKRCRWCKEIKPLDEFWGGEGAGDRRSECVACRYLKGNNYYKEGEWKKTPLRQRRAVKAVFDAIHKGDIKRPKECPICGRRPKKRNGVARIQFHHTDGYDIRHQYFGIFVCTWCHNAIHRGKITVEGRDYNPYT